MSRGRRATLPAANLADAKSIGTIGPLVVTLNLEDNPSYRFDLSRMCGPAIMRAELAQAVVNHSCSTKGARRTSSLLLMQRALSSLMRWVERWNDENKRNHDVRIDSLADITPFHLLRYRRDVEAKHTASTQHVYYGRVTLLLRLSPAVSAETWREASKRKGQGPAPAQMMRRYSKTEFTEIRNAARRCIEAAHARITAAYALAQQADDATGPDAARARALREVIAYGRPKSEEGRLTLTGTAGDIERGGRQTPRSHLFLTPAEALAATVLIACQRGLNLSPIVMASVSVEHEPGVAQLDLDKPRRGPEHRFWPEILVDSDDDAGVEIDEMGARVLKLIKEATEPLREYFAGRGQPTQRLIGYWASTGTAPRVGLPDSSLRAKADWLPAGTTIDFRRLRRSAPGQGVTKEPTGHSPETHLHYVRSDALALIEHREEAARGVQKLVDHNRARLAIRVAEDSDTNPAHDAVVANCSDPWHRPDTGQPCTTGFYSFLDCLACGNAATVPRLLPRQVATLRVLESLRDSLGEVWERRFANHYETLAAIVERHSPAERELAAIDAEDGLPSILAALRHEVPQ